MKSFPVPIIALALSAFAIGTTEFVIMGLLPQVAGNLSVSIPTAGWLVSGYALGVFIGAPIMAITMQKLPHRTALMALMGIFILGNALCALSPSYGFLMAARIITALCHGAFFGIGAVEAASLVPEHRRAQAVALMFTGLTLANVLGVPLGTALGQAAGWRATFWAVAILGVASLIGLYFLLPRHEKPAEHPNMFRELTAIKAPAWAALATTVLFSASAFTLFTYIAPVLNNITHVSPRGVTYTLFLVGLGLTLGNFLGGRLADWHLFKTLAGIFLCAALVLAVLNAHRPRPYPGRDHAVHLGDAHLRQRARPADQRREFRPRRAEPHLHPQHRRLQRRQRARRLGRRRSHRQPPRLRCHPPCRRRPRSGGPAPCSPLPASSNQKDPRLCQPCLTP